MCKQNKTKQKKRDKELRSQAQGFPLVYATLSTVWAILVTTIFFRLGWSNAERGTNICQAWKAYQTERKADLQEKIAKKYGKTVDHDTSDANDNDNDLNSKSSSKTNNNEPSSQQPINDDQETLNQV